LIAEIWDKEYVLQYDCRDAGNPPGVTTGGY